MDREESSKKQKDDKSLGWSGLFQRTSMDDEVAASKLQKIDSSAIQEITDILGEVSPKKDPESKQKDLSGKIDGERPQKTRAHVYSQSSSYSKPIKKEIDKKRSVSINESVLKYSVGIPQKFVKEKSKLGKFLDNHLDQFLEEALTEFRDKSNDRRTWADRIWVFTLCICLTTLLLLVSSYFYDLFFKKPLISEKLVYVLVGGMFAQIISLMIIVMKYVFSPSKDAYVYLTELVKVRKLRDGHEIIEEEATATTQVTINDVANDSQN